MDGIDKCHGKKNMVVLTIDRHLAFSGSGGSCHEQCTIQHVLSLPDASLLYHATCSFFAYVCPCPSAEVPKTIMSSCLPSHSLSSSFCLKDQYILFLHAYPHSWSSSVSHFSSISLTTCYELRVCPVFPMTQALFPLPVYSPAWCSPHCSKLDSFRRPYFASLYFHGTLKPMILSW